MPQYLAPGVYIEELPGPKPFQAVGTATGGFIGIAEKGPIGEARLITNWTQFVETFGGFIPSGYLAYAVNQFFSEGGTKCWVVRTCSYDYASVPAQHRASKGAITLKDVPPAAGTASDTLRLEALTPGSWSDHVWVEVTDATKDTSKFRMIVWHRDVAVESFEELTKDNVIGIVRASSKYISAAHAGTSTAQPGRSETRLMDAAVMTDAILGITALAAGLVVLVSHTGADRFELRVVQTGNVVERYVNLSMIDVEQKVNGISRYIKARALKSSSRPAATGTLVLMDSAASATPPTTPLPTLSVTALLPGLTLEVAAGSAIGTFKLTVRRGTSVVDYDNLTILNVENAINGISPYIEVKNLASATAAPDNRPLVSAAADLPATSLTFFALADGDDGLATGLVLKDAAGTSGVATLQVNAFRDGVSVKVTAVAVAKFKLSVLLNGAEVEVFDELIMDAVEADINGRSQYIEVQRPAALNPNRPLATASAVAVPTTGLADMDFIGDEATKNGLHAFDVVDDINIIAIPDRPGDREVIIAAYSYCQNRRDCFFVADAPFGLKPADVLGFKQATGALFSGNAFNSSYAALYYPWVVTSDPLSGASKFVPPSGAVVGTYSSTDVARGVHKAPAGTIDGSLNSVVGIEYLVTKGEQELLNPENINVIRSFPGSGIVIWGARTLSADPEWRYVNVRRLLLYIEETIDKNTQWVVFEPNDQLLWARVKRDVSSFLTDVWRSGALFGTTAEQAFYVKIDNENNPPEVRDAGRLVVDIGVSPVKPAEFVVFRITQVTPKK